MIFSNYYRNEKGFALVLEVTLAITVIVAIAVTAVVVQTEQDRQTKKAQLAAEKAAAASNVLPPGTYVINNQPKTTTTKTSSSNTPQSSGSTTQHQSSSASDKTSTSSSTPPQPVITHPTVANCGSTFTAYGAINSGAAVYQGSNSSLVIGSIPFGTAVRVSCFANNAPWVNEEESPYGSMLYGELSITVP